MTMRPGFLNGANYWFGELPLRNPDPDKVAWRRSSSRPTEVFRYYTPQTHIDWHKQFYVEEPVERRYQ